MSADITSLERAALVRAMQRVAQGDRAALQADFKPVTIGNATFWTHYGVQVEKIVSHNIVGVLPGTKY